MKIRFLFPAISMVIYGLFLAVPDAKAGKSSSSSGPGTGGKAASTDVRGHFKKDGTYVPPHHRTTPDKNINNNWSTKPNSNPYTGKEGSKNEPPSKP